MFSACLNFGMCCTQFSSKTLWFPARSSFDELLEVLDFMHAFVFLISVSYTLMLHVLNLLDI